MYGAAAPGDCQDFPSRGPIPEVPVEEIASCRRSLA